MGLYGNCGLAHSSMSGPSAPQLSGTHRPVRCTRILVAAYIAKYATKAAEDFGLAAQRIHPLADFDGLPVSEHVRRLLLTAGAYRLGGRLLHVLVEAD